MADELPLEAERLLFELALVEGRITRARAALDRRHAEIARPLVREIDHAPAGERSAMQTAAVERLRTLLRTVHRSEFAHLAAAIVTDDRRRAVILQQLERFAQLGDLPPPSAGFELRGTFSSAESYQHLDVVAMDGGSFAAKRDNPGPCPGEGWQLLAQRGKPGRDGRDPNRMRTPT